MSGYFLVLGFLFVLISLVVFFLRKINSLLLEYDKVHNSLELSMRSHQEDIIALRQSKAILDWLGTSPRYFCGDTTIMYERFPGVNFVRLGKSHKIGLDTIILYSGELSDFEQKLKISGITFVELI